MPGPMFSARSEESSLAASDVGLTAVSDLAVAAVEQIRKGMRDRETALPAGRPGQVDDVVAAVLAGGILPDRGRGGRDWPELLRGFVAGIVDLTADTVAANLQAPVLAIAAVADFAAGVTGQSVDAWESGPSGIALERELIAALWNLLGHSGGDGVLTPGSTQSNLLALLLAREQSSLGASFENGIGPTRRRPRILASELAHLSIQRAAGVLGLGQDAVIPVPIDAENRMLVGAAADRIAGLAEDEFPMALVGTAGTTDFGSVDPLDGLADLARSHSAWFHVDAAYGGAAMFSDRARGRFRGIERADSVSLDLHKLGWQPAPAAAMLLRDPATAIPLDCNVACVNPRDDEQAGYVGRFARTLQTTRRADALKIVATLRVLGRDGMAELVDACLDLAVHAADRISAHPRLRLVSEPQLSVVVFRYLPVADGESHVISRINAGIRRRLMRETGGSVGRVDVATPSGLPEVCLKFTFVNPYLSQSAVEDLIDMVVQAGSAEEAQG
ncbi:MULTISPECIES: pyridoxal phosphate-dependent decarboxylase family protein [Amycolatopsis]|uniref:Pyridoxal phosphate-dependent decarboxylase family protein n=1 Tax=Amycolatopsis albidoflavus TaxID=102226 RepID=A0ABW5HS65_9PSEU